MKIILDNIGKRYNNNWIFRNVNYCFNNKASYALTGNNGSGKSTLLMLVYNFITISQGKIFYYKNNQLINDDAVANEIAFTAPYLELPEEFTLAEMLHFHFKLVKPITHYNENTVLLESGLAGNEKKQIKAFSSGMKQRLKLILCLFSNTPLLILDEPTTNLDEHGIAWYKQLMAKQKGTRTIIVASNQTYEYDFCDNMISMAAFKP